MLRVTLTTRVSRLVHSLFKTEFTSHKAAYQIRKHAIDAERVGLIAKVVEDLQEALLAGGGL